MVRERLFTVFGQSRTSLEMKLSHSLISCEDAPPVIAPEAGVAEGSSPPRPGLQRLSSATDFPIKCANLWKREAVGDQKIELQ
jgi:hypothetical protein